MNSCVRGGVDGDVRGMYRVKIPEKIRSDTGGIHNEEAADFLNAVLYMLAPFSVVCWC